MEINERYKMPFGKYKDKSLASIPDDYLIWLHKQLNKKCSKFTIPLRDYLNENISEIKANIKEANPKPYFND